MKRSVLAVLLLLSALSTASAQGRPAKWAVNWNERFYTSATVTSTGNTGVIATPLIPPSGNPAAYPLMFVALGQNMATDETNTVTVDWYADSVGNLTIGTTTFDQMTAGTPRDLEVWPGDVTAFNAGRDLVPLPPYCKITWTLAGTTISMSFTLDLSYQILSDVATR